MDAIMYSKVEISRAATPAAAMQCDLNYLPIIADIIASASAAPMTGRLLFMFLLVIGKVVYLKFSIRLCR